MNRLRTTISLASCAVMTILMGCATGESVVSPAFYDLRPDRIAVIDIAGDIRGNAPKNQVEDYFAMVLYPKSWTQVYCG